MEPSAEPSNSNTRGARNQNGAGKTWDGSNKQRVKLWHRFEMGLLGAVIVVVWVLLSVPIILYYIPDSDTDEESSDTCSHEEENLYTGECEDVLLDLQRCLPDEAVTDTSTVYVSEGLNFSELDLQVRTLKAGLDMIEASPECECAAIPFFCLYLFGLCDASGSLHQPSYNDCISISTDTCAREWATVAAEYGSNITLPQCDSFQMTNSICNNTGNKTNQTSGPSNSSPTTPMVISLPANASDNGSCSNSGSCYAKVCSDGFYCSDNGTCLPLCDGWETFPHNRRVAMEVSHLLIAILGVIFAILVLFLSCINHKKMFAFPSVIFIYLTIAVGGLDILLLIPYIDRAKLFCSSCDYLESLYTPTFFCTFSGAAFLYVAIQILIWWFCHVLLIFWKIRFPFHARNFEIDGYMKYLHIAVLMLGLLAPFITIAILFGTTLSSDGNVFLPVYHPPIICLNQHLNVMIYAVMYPVVFFSQIGGTVLIMLFWVIHKQHGLFMIKQMKTPYTVGTPERKILIIFCYSVALLLTLTLSLALGFRDDAQFQDLLTEYFECEAYRKDSDPQCPRSYLDKSVFELLAVSLALFELVPGVYLIFVINTSNVKNLKKKFYGWCRPTADQ